MSRSIKAIAQDIEALLIEYHLARQEEDLEFGDETITGVDFLIGYDVKVLDDVSTGTRSYMITGPQSGTTTLGLNVRLAACVENPFLFPDEDD